MTQAMRYGRHARVDERIVHLGGSIRETRRIHIHRIATSRHEKNTDSIEIVIGDTV